MTNIFSAEFTETTMKTFAEQLAAIWRPGDCVALYGDLGAGKSTFLRAAIHHLTGETNIPSPTFTLVQHYEAPESLIWHFDLYRLKAPEEIYELGWEDAGQGIVLVEWPQRLGSLLSHSCLAIHLDFHQHRHTRLLTLKGNETWANRLAFLRN